jgi:glycosyltransferase involved in cell wall biosynthesis
MLEIVRPDAVVLQNDPWNFPAYLKPLSSSKVIGIAAVDGKNCRGNDLNGLARAIFWTEFGRREAHAGGYTGDSAVIPLGVQLSTYRPIEKIEARKHFQFGRRFQNSFMVGNVNRNQPRKRMDLTIQYFAEWIKSDKVDDAYLFLHVAPTGDSGYDCAQLAKYYGIEQRTILSEPEVWNGLKEEELAVLYSCFDVQLSTTQGEGWGLTAMEGMACGVPQVLPRWSALGEWAQGAALLVPCTTTAATPDSINVIGGVPDREETIKTLRVLYKQPRIREEYRDMGLSLVQEDRFRWENIGARYAEEIEIAVDAPAQLRAYAEIA